MLYYILLIAFILILRSQVFAKTDPVLKRTFENKCCIAVWCVIILLAALRHPIVGADTYSYISDYENVKLLSFAEIADRYEGYLGFFYTSKVFSLMGMPVQVWFGFLEALYAYSMVKFINRYSKDKLFSILVFVTIGLLSFSFAGLKQVMSMSLMMLAFLTFVDKKYVTTACLICGAYTCHPSSQIFLAAFPFYLLRNKGYSMLLIILSTLFVVLYSSLFMRVMADIIENEHYEVYLEYNDSYTSTTLIFYSVIVAISFLGYKSYLSKKAGEARLCLGFSIITIGLQSMASISPNMFRLAFLYSPFMMILLPNACAYNRNQSLMRVILIVAIAFYCIYVNRGFSYLFFWQ